MPDTFVPPIKHMVLYTKMVSFSRGKGTHTTTPQQHDRRATQAMTTNAAQLIAQYMSPFLLLAVGAQLCFQGLLEWRRSRLLKEWLKQLEALTATMEHKTSYTSRLPNEQMVEARVRDVLESLSRGDWERKPELGDEMRNLRTNRPWDHGWGVRNAYNAVRTLVECYPLLGILGTIAALGVALGGEREASDQISVMMRSFSAAVWSTFWGILAAVAFMGLYSWRDGSFERYSRCHERLSDIGEKVDQLHRERQARAGNVNAAGAQPTDAPRSADAVAASGKP